MMKKFLIYIIFLFLGFNLFAQDDLELDPINGAQQVKVIPPSPEAAALGNFGNIPIGLYTGTATHSVPLYVVEGRNISVPITLNYSTNGVKIDEICTWVGTGWTLDAGGLITRTIKGQEDGFEVREVPKMNQACLLYDEFISFESADTEHDVYSFNFMGNSGKFIIVNNEIKQFEQSGLKIEMFNVHNPYRFVITDTKGVKYFFGGVNEDGKKAVEFTIMDQGPSNDTAWYLSKIVDLSGEEIIFDYLVNNTFYSYTTNYSESLESLVVNYAFIPILGPIYNPVFHNSTVSNGSTAFVKIYCGEPSNIAYGSNSVKNNGVYLNKIYVKDGVDFVNFASQTRNHPGYTSLKKLVSIVGLNKKIELNINENKWYRMYLKDIVFKSLIGNEFQKQSFDYNNEDFIPSRDSKSVDSWGYFNGESNSSLLNGRRNPNAVFGQNGTLKTIHYPTGGRTEITYEGHSSKIFGRGGCISNEDLMLGWFTGQAYSTTSTTDNFSYNFLNFTIPSNNGGPNQIIDFTFLGKYTIPEPNINGATIGKCFFSLINSEGSVFRLDYTHDINKVISYELPPGDYTLTLGVRSSIYKAAVLFNYCDEVSNEIYIIKKYAGGVRVKEIKDINFDNEIINHKKYEYSNEKLSYPEKEKYVYKRSIIEGSTGIFSTNSMYFPYCIYKIKMSNGEIKGKVSDQHFFYGKVSEIIVGDNSEIETIHYFKSSVLNQEVPIYLENSSFQFHSYKNAPPSSNIIGQPVEIRTDYYKTNPISGEKMVVKRVENTISYEILDYFPSFIVEKMSGPTRLLNTYNLTNSNGDQLECMDIQHLMNFTNIWRYFNIAYRVKEKETKVTEFSFNGSIHMDDLVTRTIEYYENPSHSFLTKLKKETSVSESGPLNVSKKESIKYFYPNDIVNTSASNSYVGENFDALSVSSFENMILQNKISTPVQVETYSDDNYPLSIQRTLYKSWDFTILLNNNLVVNSLDLPCKIQALKGEFDNTNNPFEDRIEINRYSLFGQILEIKKTSGSPISYVYGYNNRYVVAIAENATYNNLESINSQLNENTVGLIGNQLPNAQVTVFKYQPKVGMIQKTMPNGMQITYQYDEFDRLIEVKEGKHIILENEYNYKH